MPEFGRQRRYCPFRQSSILQTCPTRGDGGIELLGLKIVKFGPHQGRLHTLGVLLQSRALFRDRRVFVFCGLGPKNLKIGVRDVVVVLNLCQCVLCILLNTLSTGRQIVQLGTAKIGVCPVKNIEDLFQRC